MYHQQRKLPLIIKKSNEFTRTQLSVENNALANSIFATLIRHVDEEFFPTVSFSAGELIGGEATKGGDGYRRLKIAARVLMRAIIDSVTVDKTGKETGFHMVNIFESCRYENGTVSAVFSHSLKHHLLGLKNHFTALNYFELIELSSFYSQRIYELLKSWEKPNGFAEIRLDALYDLISFPKELRTNFIHIRTRALGQAEKEINEKTELKFRWEPIKEGRKVVAIRFVIGEQGQKTDKKRQTKKQEKEKKEAWEASDRRKPYLDAARQCRLDHSMKAGDTCNLAKPRSKKCKFCSQTAGVTYYNQDSLF